MFGAFYGSFAYDLFMECALRENWAKTSKCFSIKWDGNDVHRRHRRRLRRNTKNHQYHRRRRPT